jgi:hypothetical protein
MLRLGDVSRSQLQAYDTILRQRYQNLFRFSEPGQPDDAQSSCA